MHFEFFIAETVQDNSVAQKLPTKVNKFLDRLNHLPKPIDTIKKIHYKNFLLIHNNRYLSTTTKNEIL